MNVSVKASKHVTRLRFSILGEDFEPIVQEKSIQPAETEEVHFEIEIPGGTYGPVILCVEAFIDIDGEEAELGKDAVFVNATRSWNCLPYKEIFLPVGET